MGKSIWLDFPTRTSLVGHPYSLVCQMQKSQDLFVPHELAVGNKWLGLSKNVVKKNQTLRIYEVIIFPHKGPRQLFMLVYKH